MLASVGSSFATGRALGARSGVVSLAPARQFALSVDAAHKKGAGSTKNGRDSQSKRRGVKVYGGQPVKAGGIIVRQLGSTVRLCVWVNGERAATWHKALSQRVVRALPTLGV